MPRLKVVSQNLRVVRKGFPVELQETFDDVFRKYVKQYNSYPVRTSVNEFFLSQDEKIFIPARIHTDPYAPGDLDAIKKLIYDCIYSRSTEGFSREEALRSLHATKPLPFWAISYLYLSLSDYVIEISSIVKPGDRDIIHAFQKLSELNPEQYRLARARATSYWSEYYRYMGVSGRKVSKQEYSALKVIERIAQDARIA